MSAQLDNLPAFRLMRADDLDFVLEIENDVYPYPWTHGNFIDSLAAGYCCSVMEQDGEMIGYGVLMVAADESHLLNLSIARQWQRQGWGRVLLHHFMQLARTARAVSMYLETRPTNAAARALYAREGFVQLAVRRGYYPAAQGREDALLLGLKL